MGDANEIVEDLERKLQDLNDKLIVYHRDLLAGFEKHKQDQLKDCPDEVTAEVDRRIAESMSNYPALQALHHQDAHHHHHHHCCCY